MDDPTIAAESRINDLERIIRNAGPLALSHSSFLQAELYLSNFERLREDLSILINNYIEEPAVLAHLMELWDRMEAALTGYLAKKAEMVEDGVIAVPANEPLDLNYEADFAEAERVQRFEWMAENHTPSSSVERSDGDDREAARASLPQPDPASRIECLICGDEYPGSETFIFQCHHQYCTECVVGMLETAITNGKVLDIRCPDPTCARNLEVVEIKAAVSPTMFGKYQEFRYVATMNANPLARWCPAPDCNTCMTNGSGDEPHLTCSKCRTQFCFNCGASDWHETMSCEEYKASKGIRETKQEKEFRKWASKHTKKCPQCKAPIEKNDGCNHMTCIHCHFQFCWLCGGRYTDNHYDVYNIAGCPGMQFSEANSRLSRARRFGFRALIGTGIVVGAPIAIAVGIPALVIGGPIYGAVKLAKRRRRYSFNVAANNATNNMESTPLPDFIPAPDLTRVRPVQHQVLLLGPVGSGRTALGVRLAHNEWNPDTAEFAFDDLELQMEGVSEAGPQHALVIDPLAEQASSLSERQRANTTVNLALVSAAQARPQLERSVQEARTAVRPGAPTLLVYTQLDQLHPTAARIVAAPPAAEFAGVHAVSALSGEGIAELRQSIFALSQQYMHGE